VTPPKMPIHIGDYKRDTGHLRAAEHGAYLLLLFHHWSTGALPDDDRQLSAIACMTPAEWKRSKPIIQKFFKDGWVHSRVVSDLEEANASYERRARAGKEGGKARANGKHCSSNATAMPEQPITDNQKEDRIGDARASKSAFTEGSKALSASLWRGLSIESPLGIPPELAGADWRAIEWERAGWTEDLIETECRRVGPGKPLNYYEKCFASAFAKRQAPLPNVEIRQAETITVNHGKPKAGIIQAADNLIAKLAEFDGPPREPDELRGDARQDSPRLLSHG
jgi:uncharacterized protein YdaU (DUF1376 family)